MGLINLVNKYIYESQKHYLAGFSLFYGFREEELWNIIWLWSVVAVMIQVSLIYLIISKNQSN